MRSYKRWLQQRRSCTRQQRPSSCSRRRRRGRRSCRSCSSCSCEAERRIHPVQLQPRGSKLAPSWGKCEQWASLTIIILLGTVDNSEKLFLTWNDFEDNQKSSFALLRNDTDLTNVTLAFEDGKQVEVHKVVLATSSSF